ncbi:DNA ligase D [Paracoccus sanguinis]|uniref:DNA ligase (ATP) n=1 Tax=Paracoccus sanguinis TaxID=1545044 RepID=A0A1H2ZU87_9RHOB|nr:DNA ligase D [Paracoccus sanguinis]KGJ16123.1 ATP-dependent DNA ligase [Paracoccus sanguinis]SDX20935.1 ATP-dependent DNA ligase LigD phosphoesterase module /ATP-dependent DNA ligase LigD polymerase module [Paracoccus sanguinis]
MDRLAPYAAKRDPAKTPEPFEPGTPSGGALRYSMQNHDATRLHWDLRLEWEGVLLSWAVTRGPSLDPADKRLAVRTEDHPLPYLTFEGTIPRGEYGAGTVMLWDIGHWRPVEDAARGLTKGHLRFQLYGRRLTGLWDLVRIKGKPADKGRENWLMVKAEDAAAHQPDPVARYTTSISSGRDFAAIASGAKAVPPGPAEPLALPKPAEPMLAKLVTDPLEGDDWLHEVKIDGYRGLVHLGRGGPVIRTRNGLDWTDRFAPLVPVLASLPARSALIDGEIVAGAGAQGFAALQQAITDGGPFGYVAFDLLELDGASLRREPLTARRAALAALLGDQPPLGILQMSVALPGDGAAALGAICAAGGEGIVSKRAASLYRAGRSDSWRKIKCDRRTAFAVIGWAKSDSPGRPFASLLLASPEGDGWRYRGRVGTGFSGEVQADLAARMAPLTRKTAPAAVPRSETRGVTWVEPALMAEVRYAEETTGGILRHASFQGLREDKMAPPAPPEPPVVRVERVTAGRKVAGVTITNPDRVIFPEPGVTKGELAEYYAAAAPRMLAHCANRPLSLVRLPEGMGGQSFFQKHAGKGFPAQIAQTDLPGEDEPALYVTSAAGLVAGAQMGVVEYHIRGVLRDRPDRPDRIVFDLDPDEGLGFAEVKAAAFDLRDRLAALGLPTWPMLTGGKGIHVVGDLRRTAGWEVVKLFARSFAYLLAAEAPERYVAVMSKARREGKIFIDWLRNDTQATAIAPFSCRARAGATVAVPLSWAALEAETSAAAYDVRTALEAAPRIAPARAAPVGIEKVARALVGD